MFIAALVRLWGIGFGLPNPLIRPDELTHAQITVSIASGDLNPHFFKYSSLYFYLMALVHRVVFIFIGAPGPGAFDEFIFQHIFPLFMSGRLFNAFIGTSCVAVVYWLGLRLGDRRTGVLASLLLALNYLHARDSHFMSVDGTMTLLVTLSLITTLRAIEVGTTKSLLYAAVLAGLAASVKYNAALLALSILAAHIIMTRREGLGWSRIFLSRRIWLSGLVMICVFILTSPYMLLDYREFILQFIGESRHFRLGEYKGPTPYSVPGFYVMVVMRHGLGVIPGLLMLSGLGLLLYRKDPRSYVVLAFMTAYCLLLVSGKTVFARYLVPLMPLMCALAAVALANILNRVPRNRLGRLLAMVLLAAVVAQSLWNIRAFDRLLSREDTRSQATTWINDRLEKAQIMQVGGIGEHNWVMHQPQLPGFGLLYIDSNYQQLMAKFDMAFYRGQGYRYVITHQHPLPFSTVLPELWDKLTEQAKMRVCFNPHNIDNPAPAVFDHEDAFYVPFAKFRGTKRPGPRICIFELPEK